MNVGAGVAAVARAADDGAVGANPQRQQHNRDRAAVNGDRSGIGLYDGRYSKSQFDELEQKYREKNRKWLKIKEKQEAARNQQELKRFGNEKKWQPVRQDRGGDVGNPPAYGPRAQAPAVPANPRPALGQPRWNGGAGAQQARPVEGSALEKRRAYDQTRRDALRVQQQREEMGYIGAAGGAQSAERLRRTANRGMPRLSLKQPMATAIPQSRPSKACAWQRTATSKRSKPRTQAPISPRPVLAKIPRSCSSGTRCPDRPPDPAAWRRRAPDAMPPAWRVARRVGIRSICVQVCRIMRSE